MALFDDLDSSVLIPFSANGSGDFDSACFTFPSEGTHCAESEPAAGSEFLQIDWSSEDGRLTPEDEDWLTFETRPAGTHQITLTLNDGINPNVSASTTLEVAESAPVLVLDSPANGSQFASSDLIVLDARQSVDYDGDAFTMTVRAFDDQTSTYLPILRDVLTSEVHDIQLDAGLRDVQIELADETGNSRIEALQLLILPRILRRSLSLQQILTPPMLVQASSLKEHQAMLTTTLSHVNGVFTNQVLKLVC